MKRDIGVVADAVPYRIIDGNGLVRGAWAGMGCYGLSIIANAWMVTVNNLSRLKVYGKSQKLWKRELKLHLKTILNPSIG